MDRRQLDQLARAHILTGAFGLRPFLFRTENPAKALADLRLNSEREGRTVHPAWFGLADTGIVSRVLHAVEVVLGDPEEAYDVLVDTLMGFSTALEQRTLIPWKAGANPFTASRILSGSPPTAQSAYKLYSRWAAKSAISRRAKTQRHETLAPLEPDLPVERHPAEVLVEILQCDHPLAEVLRSVLVRSWRGTAQAETMDLWLDSYMRGDPISKTELAEHFGVTAAAITARWQVGMARAYKAVAADDALLALLSNEGLDIDPTLTEDIFRSFSFVKDFDRL